MSLFRRCQRRVQLVLPHGVHALVTPSAGVVEQRASFCLLGLAGVLPLEASIWVAIALPGRTPRVAVRASWTRNDFAFVLGICRCIAPLNQFNLVISSYLLNNPINNVRQINAWLIVQWAARFRLRSGIPF
jgi:hypothetical protein